MRAISFLTDAASHPGENRRERYGLLLAALIASFFVQGVAHQGPWEQVAVTILLALTLLLALWAADARLSIRRGAFLIALIVIAASIAIAAAGKVDSASVRLANMLLVVLAPPAIVVGVVRSLRARQSVTVEAVFGVLCIYILVGMFFAFLYGAIGRFNGPFFAGMGASAGTVSNCLYFSFITLTTVGYGDFTAAGQLGHTLSSIEALMGQIYLVTIVSVIVANLGRVRQRQQ
jgi:hypothetical protein